MRKRKLVVNADLWERLLTICEKPEVEFVWVEGNAGQPENEWCDLLSVVATRSAGLPPDVGYEECLARKDIREPVQPTLFD